MPEEVIVVELAETTARELAREKRELQRKLNRGSRRRNQQKHDSRGSTASTRWVSDLLAVTIKSRADGLEGSGKHDQRQRQDSLDSRSDNNSTDNNRLQTVSESDDEEFDAAAEGDSIESAVLSISEKLTWNPDDSPFVDEPASGFWKNFFLCCPRCNGSDDDDDDGDKGKHRVPSTSASYEDTNSKSMMATAIQELERD